jgi:three-Cys-motif partner protein
VIDRNSKTLKRIGNLMNHISHSWSDASRPPTIRAHSIEKHRLLEAYLARYVATLTQNVKIDHLSLTLVDGFAGGNVYTDPATGAERPGSPSIIMGAIREAERQAREKRTKDFKIDDHYFFIEKDREAFSSLERTLKSSGHAAQIGESIFALNDDFADQADRIIEFILAKSKSGRSIFVLDQCGYTQVPFRCIRDILDRVPNAEIILTFAADFLIDYLRESRPNRRLASIPDLNLDDLAASVDKADPRWRRLIQLELHSEVQKASAASFYTPFFIHSKDSHRDLWLVHLSRHHRARDVMVGVHWDRQNCFAHYGKPGLRMLGYHPDEDILNTRQPFFEGFYFDDKARAMTKESLMEDLPALIYDHPEMVSFKGLFSSISNDTPATSEILKASLLDLAEDERVIIKDATGLTLRRAGVQHDSDLIYIPRQKRLFY